MLIIGPSENRNGPTGVSADVPPARHPSLRQQVLSGLFSVIYEAGLRRQRSNNVVVLRSRKSVRRCRRGNGNAVNRSATIKEELSDWSNAGRERAVTLRTPVPEKETPRSRAWDLAPVDLVVNKGDVRERGIVRWLWRFATVDVYSEGVSGRLNCRRPARHSMGAGSSGHITCLQTAAEQ